MKFFSLVFFLLFSAAAHAENCKVILADGYEVEAAKVLQTRGFELVDETKLEDPSTVWFRIYNLIEEQEHGGVQQTLRFNRDLETLVSVEFGNDGLRFARENFMNFLATLPTCQDIYDGY